MGADDRRGVIANAELVGRALVRRAVVLLMASLCSLVSADAQTSGSQRPRIGLALGGGGGRGLAHIGVLEWFEANHIPVDLIAGTSIGGLVAGGWAAGMSPAELRTLMREADWDNMFLADSPYTYKTLRRKEDARAFPSQLRFGLKGGFHVPTGLNPGQRVLWMLNRMTLPYGPLRSFDDLPTPFRCVATDLIKSEVVVLDRGSLSTALRATMATPGVFSPVALDGRLLVDGGTLDNIPADVVRAMGADVVIAVDVSADYDGQAGAIGLTMFEVLGRTIDTMMLAGTRVSLKTADLVLDPDLTKRSASDWRHSDDLADRGLDAAAAKADALGRFRLDDDAWASYVAGRAARTPTRTPNIDLIEVRGVDEDDTEVIGEALDVPLGRPLDVEALELALANLTGNGRYDTVGYQVEPRGHQRALVLEVVPKSYAPPFLNFAFDLQSRNSTNFSANGRMRVVFLDVLNAGSEVRADLTLGSTQLAAGELFLPLGRSRRFGLLGSARMFVAPRVSASRAQRNAFVDGQLVAEYVMQRTGAGLDVGFTSGRRSEVRVGYDIASVRAHVRVGPPLLPADHGSERFVSLRYTFDGSNSALVPWSGTLAHAALKHYFLSGAPEPVPIAGGPVPADRRFWQGEATATRFFHVRVADRVFVTAAAGSSFGKVPVVDAFRLGGPFRLGSKNIDEVSGPNYALGVVGYLRQVGRLRSVFGSSVLAGAWVESGSAFTTLTAAHVHANLSTGVVAETLLGPAYGAVSVGIDGGLKFYIALAPLFR